jgi:hypothetical protein
VEVNYDYIVMAMIGLEGEKWSIVVERRERENGHSDTAI